MRMGKRYKEDRLEILVSRMIESGIAAHTADPDLHRIFGRFAPEAQTDNREPASDVLHFNDVKESLEMHGVEPEDAEFAAWLFRTVVHAAIHEGVYHRHEDIVSGRLSKALNMMITGWLEKTIGPEKQRR